MLTLDSVESECILYITQWEVATEGSKRGGFEWNDIPSVPEDEDTLEEEDFFML